MNAPETEFRRRMLDRMDRWYLGKDPHPDPARQARRIEVAGLVNKTNMQAYARRMDIPLPEQYDRGATVDDIDFTALPDRVVIKPDNASSSAGVMLFDGNRELMSRKWVPRFLRKHFVRRTLGKASDIPPGGTILAEEFLLDFDPAFQQARDFKAYAAGGRVQGIGVLTRTGREWTTRTYTRDWVPLDRFRANTPMADPIPRPPMLDDYLTLVDRIASDLGCLIRIDCYMTNRGVLLGEFTSFPSAGLNFTPMGDRLLCDLMDRYPDPF